MLENENETNKIKFFSKAWFKVPKNRFIAIGIIGVFMVLLIVGIIVGSGNDKENSRIELGQIGLLNNNEYIIRDVSEYSALSTPSAPTGSTQRETGAKWISVSIRVKNTKNITDTLSINYFRLVAGNTQYEADQASYTWYINGNGANSIVGKEKLCYMNIFPTIESGFTKELIMYFKVPSDISVKSSYLNIKWAGSKISMNLYYTQLPITMVYNDDITEDKVLTFNLGTKFNGIPVPSKKGYLFDGWCIDETLQTKITEGVTIVDKSIEKLYAKWKLAEYSIIFVENNYTNPNTITSYNIFSNTISLLVPTRAGYTFRGWYDNEQLNGNPVTEIKKGSYGEISLFASWEANVYLVDLIFDDGETENQQISVIFDDKYTDLPTPVREGYIFEGWYKNKDEYDSLVSLKMGNTDYYYDNVCNTSSNHSLYAKWIEGTSGLTLELKNDAWIVNGSTSDSTSLVIPNSIAGLPIVAISAYAFNGMSLITEVVVQNSVTEIGENAFNNCYSIEKITLPFAGANKIGKTTTNIGEAPGYLAYIFGRSENNSSLYYQNMYYSKPYYLPNTLKEVKITNAIQIGDNAFYGAKSIEVLEINDGITSIGTSAFSQMISLLEFIIPSTVTTIGNSAFSNVKKLTKLDIPKAVTIINDRAFEGLSLVETLAISENVTKIGVSAFSGWSSIRELTIPNKVTSIGTLAFSDMNLITEVVVPNSVTEIGENAFYNCYSIEKITLPFAGANKIGKTTTNIGEAPGYLAYIFGRSENNSSLYYQSRYYSQPYYLPNTLKEVKITNAIQIGDNAFYGAKSIEMLEINDGITSIGTYAFSQMISLLEFVIPSTVTTIGNSAFSGCSNLVIYARISSKPSGWHSDWNPNDRPVNWS